MSTRFTVISGREIEALWQEYEDGKSPEALMIKDFDKVCPIALASLGEDNIQRCSFNMLEWR